MSGIVIELERDCLNEAVSIETLMRKAFLVSRKLKLSKFEDWINQEQNGYKNKVPEYRYVKGEIRAWNPYHGWIPVQFSQNSEEIMSNYPIVFPISQIFDIYKSKDDEILLSVSAMITGILNKGSDFPTKFSFFVSKTEFYKIISIVRDKLLDWTLLLEENNIIGEDMSFTNGEIQTAQNSKIINNYINSFYNTVTDLDIKQG